MATLLLAKHLKELREYHNYTQEYVSAQLNIERPSYSNYELGKRTPTLNLVVSIAEFYHVSIDDLLCNPDFSPDLTAAKTDDAEDEKELLSLYRSFSVRDKEELLSYARFRKML